MKKTIRFLIGNFRTPLGQLWALATDKGIIFTNFSKPTKKSLQDMTSALAPLSASQTNKARQHLRALEIAFKKYIKGDLSALEKVKVNTTGTDFQNAIWKKMRDIKPGSVLSYGELANISGYPQAARAVGSACAKNPVCLVVPCHRVITSNHKIGGYSGGLFRKRKLLALEGVTLN